MVVAEVTLTTGEFITIIGAVVMGLVTTVVFLFKAFIKGKDERIEELISQRNSYKEIGDEAIDHMEELEEVLARRSEKPRRKIPKLVKVVPEHNSPTTLQQREDADLQTTRARLVATTLALGLEARVEAPNGDEPHKTTEEKVVDKAIEKIGEQMIKTTEKKIIKEVKASKEDIIQHLDENKPD